MRYRSGLFTGHSIIVSEYQGVERLQTHLKVKDYVGEKIIFCVY